VREAALVYVERRWSPVSIPFREKGPRGKGWYRQDPSQWAQHFNGEPQNIGIILGTRSGGLTDVDLDCPEALVLAPNILPPTSAMFGRESKPASHWLYCTDLAQTRTKAVDRYEDVDDTTIVELRMGGGGKAAQTVFPPSTHPTGEIIRWDQDGVPAEVDGDDLDSRVRLLAVSAMIARHWSPNADQQTWCAIGRRLVAAGAAPPVIAPLVDGLAKLMGADWRAATDAAMNVADGIGPNLAEVLGLEVARQIDRFLADGKVAECPADRAPERVANLREMAWAQAALRQCVDDLSAAGRGSRNNALNRAAFRLGGMVQRAWLERGAVEHELLEAAHTNGLVTEDGGSDKALATIRSGLDAGMGHPHPDLPDQRIGDIRRDPGAQASGGNSSDSAGANHEPADPKGVRLNDFRAYMPSHRYIFVPSREMWPAASVNARVPPVPVKDKAGKPKLDSNGNMVFLKASSWLDRHRAVEQMTWAPGEPELIEDRLVSEGGWIERKGVATFNLYRPPTIIPAGADQAGKWLDHLRRVYPEDASHILNWLAHRVQRPHEKINHALVLGGAQGIGKDTILEPVKQAIGPWNFVEVSPQQLLGRFNGFVKAVILRVSEARDLGDVDRFAFYDHLKVYTAAPPDVLRVDEKHLREYAVLNVCGVIITTNHKTDGVYLPIDDRRHYVTWSELTKEAFSDNYWREMYAWYGSGGTRHVTAYLAEVDISGFDPKAPPPKTRAFWDVVDSSRAPEDDQLADALDTLGNPAATTLEEISHCAVADLGIWLHDRKNSRQIPHRMETVGYVAVRNPADKSDGRWKVGNKRQVVYAKVELPVADRFRAATAFVASRR
jgi:hypothetical protein